MPKFLKAYHSSIPLWLIPLLYVVVTIVSGFVLPRLEHEFLDAYTHSISVASAQAALSAISSGMLALTGVVFALVFVMVQFSAVAYSPRLVAWLSNDPLLFHALGLFIATFLYAITTLGWIDRGGNGKVPLFSAMLVVVMPWMIRNSLLDHRLTGIENSLGYQLYVGYHPAGTGTFQFPQSLDLMTMLDDGQRNQVGVHARRGRDQRADDGLASEADGRGEQRACSPHLAALEPEEHPVARDAR